MLLSEVVVIASSQEEDGNSEYLGVIQKKTGSLNCCGNKLGCEYAVKMVKSDIKDEIDQIYIYFSKGGANDAPFRVKIYNEEEGRPSKLLHAVIVKPTKKLKKWNAIPISKKYITKDANIFYVAFEWLNSNEERFYYENVYKNICYGQTLGSTRKSHGVSFFLKLFDDDVWRQGGEGIISVPMVKVKMK